MTTRSVLKYIRSLHQKKVRDEELLYLAQGPKLFQELLRSGVPYAAVYANAGAAVDLPQKDLEVLPQYEMDRIGTLESGNEIVAVVRKPYWPLPETIESNLTLALDGISDPGNLGTIMRIADWFGINDIFCMRDSVDAFNPKCVQASMGAIFRVAVHYVDLPQQLRTLRENGAELYLATMEGASVFEQTLKKPAVLVLGSESHGLSEEVRNLGGRLIAVPGSGRSESLNVAMAASALSMEFFRQFRSA